MKSPVCRACGASGDTIVLGFFIALLHCLWHIGIILPLRDQWWGRLAQMVDSRSTTGCFLMSQEVKRGSSGLIPPLLLMVTLGQEASWLLTMGGRLLSEVRSSTISRTISITTFVLRGLVQFGGKWLLFPSFSKNKNTRVDVQGIYYNYFLLSRKLLLLAYLANSLHIVAIEFLPGWRNLRYSFH